MSNPGVGMLFEHDLFQGLDETQRSAIKSAIKTVRLEQGQILFTQGCRSTAFYYVVQGYVAVSRLHESGARTVLHVFGANETFAEIAAMAFADYPAEADAATDAIVLSIPSVAYRSLIERDASFAMRVIGSLYQRMRTLIGEFEQSQRVAGSGRLAAFLLELVECNSSDNGNYALPFSKQILAARLHMQPETLSRSFSKLLKYGVKSSRDGHVYITNINRLREAVHNPPA